MQITLTSEMILSEIQDFEARIQKAREKLSVLPAGPSTWKERKKHRASKRELEGEISHVQGLISIAMTALTPDECQSVNFVNKQGRYATFNH